MNSRVTLELMDLDCVRKVQDVANAINRELCTDIERKVHIFGSNNHGQAVVACEFGESQGIYSRKDASKSVGSTVEFDLDYVYLIGVMSRFRTP